MFYKGLKDLKDARCHSCKAAPLSFLTKSLKKHYCFFCLGVVCSPGCLSGDKFVIQRLFNTSFDLEPKSVCQVASNFLRSKNYLRLTISHPKVRQEQVLYAFMLKRRRLHKLFDSVHCDLRLTLMDSHAAEKNLVLLDCFLNLDQMRMLGDGTLQSKVAQLSAIIEKHI